MDNFSEQLSPANKANFKSLYDTYWKKCIRDEIYRKIISGDEADFFDYECFARKHYLNVGSIRTLVYQIVDELRELGWKIKTTYGDSVLFIYSTEDLPRGAW